MDNLIKETVLQNLDIIFVLFMQRDQFKRDLSNKILLKSSKDKKEFTFLVPYYMRLKIKDIYQINYRQSSAIINGTLILNINLTGLPLRIIKIIRSKLKIQINGCEQVEIKETNQIDIAQNIEIIQSKQGKLDKQIREMKITIRKQFHVAINRNFSTIFFSPYDQLVVIASFTLNSCKCNKKTEKITVSFNSMAYNEDIDYQLNSGNFDIFIRQIYFSKIKPENRTEEHNQAIENNIKQFKKRYQSSKHFKESLQLYFKEIRLQAANETTSGDYNISTRIFGIQDSKSAVHHKDHHQFVCKAEDGQDNQGHEDKQFKEFQYTHFCITIYKDPYPSVFTIWIPNVILGIISLSVFMLKVELPDRLSIIATLILGFIQLIPSIKDQLVDSWSYSLIENVTYFYIFLCCLSLYDSLSMHLHFHDLCQKTIEQNIGFTWSYLMENNTIFYYSCLANVMMFSCTVILLIWYQLCYKLTLIQPPFYKRSLSLTDKMCIAIKKKLNKYSHKYSQKEYNNKMVVIICQMLDWLIPSFDHLKNEDFYYLKQTLKFPSMYKTQFSKFWRNRKCAKLLERQTEYHDLYQSRKILEMLQ